MTNSFNRKNCVICKSNDLTELFTLNKMPVFMGANKNFEDIYENMTFQKCNDCCNIQIKEIINSNILYIDNHNLEIVGETWKSHYIEFCNFIKKNVLGKIILEIGDPSYKISGVISNITKEWNIVEVNPNENIIKPEKVKIIKSFFDGNFKIENKVDIVIHSHLLEHITNPIEHLKQIHSVLNNDGELLFSVPNLSEILLNGGSPNSILHFEHTYFYDENFMTKILNHCGFKVFEIKKFKNHSLFFKCKKIDFLNLKIKHDIDFSKKLLFNYNEYVNKVKNINEYLKNVKSVYLYGCHISSQFILKIGLNNFKIKNIIDNSESKESYPLYGTNIITCNPKIISEDTNPIVIISHMGIYSDEISKQLIDINKNVILL